jgi:hypothetical protein
LAVDIAEHIDGFRHGSTKCDDGHDLILASDFRASIAAGKDLPIRHFPCAHVEELLVENIACRIIAATSRVVSAR